MTRGCSYFLKVCSETKSLLGEGGGLAGGSAICGSHFECPYRIFYTRLLFFPLGWLDYLWSLFSHMWILGKQYWGIIFEYIQSDLIIVLLRLDATKCLHTQELIWLLLCKCQLYLMLICLLFSIKLAIYSLWCFTTYILNMIIPQQ